MEIIKFDKKPGGIRLDLYFDWKICFDSFA